MVKDPGVLVDVSKCTGCRGCQIACKEWNQLPAEKTKFEGSYQNPKSLSGKTWTMVHFIEPDDGNTRWLFRKHQCLHCNDASCVKVCPTGAAQKDENGIIRIDQSICTGCKYCVESCPFGGPNFNHETGTAMKCNFCLDRLMNEMPPACVKACLSGALTYGNRDNLILVARERKTVLEKKTGNPVRLYGENELRGTRWMYLLPEPASVYRLPERPRLPIDKIALRWMAGIIPGVAIIWGIWRYFTGERASEKGKGGDSDGTC